MRTVPVAIVAFVAFVALAIAGCSSAGTTGDAAADVATDGVTADGHADAVAIDEAPGDAAPPMDAPGDAAADVVETDARTQDSVADVRADVDYSRLRGISCNSPPPPGAAHPPALPRYSSGTCPRLAPGTNTIMTAGGPRRFVLVLPTGYDPARDRLPLVFIWHYLGGTANSVLNNGQVQQSADALRFIAVLPEKKTDLEIRVLTYTLDPAWPYLTYASDARVEEEARFFDDMLACVAEQYRVNEDCVSSAGISAGALWTAQLAQVRSERLSSIVLLSGGVGPATRLGLFDVRGWRSSRRPTPAMIGWGGAIDQCGIDFQRASRNLEAQFGRSGNFVEECIHNCGHSVPPVDPAAGLRVLWRFALDHPYWLAPGESPYLADGLPAETPDWCGIGIGSARARTGSCAGDGGMAAVSCPIPAL